MSNMKFGFLYNHCEESEDQIFLGFHCSMTTNYQSNYDLISRVNQANDQLISSRMTDHSELCPAYLASWTLLSGPRQL